MTIAVRGFEDCVICLGSGLARAADEEVPCRLCMRRREDEQSFALVLCSNCGRSVRLIDTVSYIGADTHQIYRVCLPCRMTAFQ